MFTQNFKAALINKLENKFDPEDDEETHLNSFAMELEKVRSRVKKMEEK